MPIPLVVLIVATRTRFVCTKKVNDLTDELKISLDKLNDTEKELKALAKREREQQLLPKPSPKCAWHKIHG